MKQRLFSWRRWLALAGATLGMVVLWGLFRNPLGTLPDPPIEVTINGTEEPNTLTDWPRCTVRNLTGRRMSINLWMCSDSATITLEDARWSAPPT